jgi:ketosteroid isomerase-like protein
MIAENTSRLSRAYELFLSGDPDSFAELLAPEAVYHLPGLHLGGGTLNGRGAILARAMSAALSFDAPPKVRLMSVSGTENFVASVERATFRRGGRVLEQRICVVWRFRDDHCVEIWSHFEDQAACDSFWNGWKPN